MRKNRTLALGAVLLGLVMSACAPGVGESPSPGESVPASGDAAGGTLSIGSQGFYESQLMAEIYAQALENAGYTVERNLGIGTREETYTSLTSGQIDMMPEYIVRMNTHMEGLSHVRPEVATDGITACI